MDRKYTNELHGIAASSGERVGTVKVILNDEDFSKIEQDDIIVTKYTTPFFTVHLMDASAIITDIGGITSHAATIARELGIPAVVGTHSATELLSDGMIVYVNGERGGVYYD